MSVKVRCTGCEKVLTAPDSARGKAIRCPTCDTKVRVPAADGKAKKKRVGEEAADSEDAIASLDLRHLEDRDSRICGKCGYDMSSMDEEETECPKCGYDSTRGGLGVRAQKKRLKGPDPDKFYSSLWKSNWQFVVKNQGLAWRTMIYTLVASVLMFTCGFLYLYIPAWPPRLFFALCGFVSGMMIPGWLWFMDEQVIIHTLQKKDKLKRINFDFALCSALGVKFLFWNLFFATPVVMVPLLIGYGLVAMAGLPTFALGIIAALAYLPVLAMMPICQGHFVMPVQAPGWMVWKVLPAWFRVLKPTMIWTLLTLAVHIPVIACLVPIGIFYGQSISVVVEQMDENAAIGRVKAAIERASKQDAAEMANNPLKDREYHKPDYTVFIVPVVLWCVACLFLGFPAMYSCRVNGQFVYYFRDSLDLIALAKEYKYVAKAQKDEFEEVKPKTMAQVTVDAVAVFVISVFIGLAIGMVQGAFSDAGLGVGLLFGAMLGIRIAYFNGTSMITKEAWEIGVGWGIWTGMFPFCLIAGVILAFVIALVPAAVYVGLVLAPLMLAGTLGVFVFTIKYWTEARTGCLVCLIAFASSLIAVVLAIAGLVAFATVTGIPQADPDVAAPQPAAPIDGGGAFPEGAVPAADPAAAGAPVP